MIRPSLAVALAAVALALLAGCGSDSGGGGGSGPPKVALLANTSYVDYNTADTGSEASNMEMVLMPGSNLWEQGITGLGLDVAHFTGISAKELTAALAGRHVLVIPEQELGALAPDLDFAAIDVLREHLNAGGVVIVCLDYGANAIPIVDALTGSAVQYGYGPDIQEVSAIDSAGSAGTPFAGGPPALQANDASLTLLASSLPADAKVVYRIGGDALVTVIPKGPGHVVVIGWDWYIDFVEETPDVQAWVDVLGRATRL